MQNQSVDHRLASVSEASASSTRWLYIVLLGLVAACLGLMLWQSIGMTAEQATAWTGVFESWVRAYCPESLLPIAEKLMPIAQKAARVYLSPWLYLLMAGVFLGEKVLPADRDQPVFSVGMVQDFLGWFVLGGVLRVALLGVFVAGLYWFCHRFLAGLRIEAVAAWPTWLAATLAILVGDLLNWLHHFIRHKVRLFWLFHTIHHSQKQMNMFTDLRVHLVEYVIAKPITIFPLFVLGLDIEIAFWLTLVLESYSRIYHGNLRTNYGPLRYVLVTPQSHRIHHSNLPEHMDKNFAVIFSFWDRLFGTQWTGYDDYPTTGVDDEQFPHESSVTGLRVVSNYVRQLLYPFKVILAGARNNPRATTSDDDASQDNT